MADYRQETRRAAERYGLDPHIFERQIQQESGFNPNARSGAGAIGIAQIMPATAKGWGVDPTNPIASLNAAAKNMAAYVKKYGSYRDALVAYNAGPGRVGGSLPAETQAYIKTILGASNPTGLASPTGSAGTTSGAAPSSSGSVPAAAPNLLGGGQASDFTSLLGSLLDKPQQQAPAPGLIAPPSFAAHPVLPQGFTPAQTSAPAPRQQDGVSGALSLIQSLGASTPSVGSGEASGPSGGIAAAVLNGPKGIAETVMAQRGSAKRSGVVPLGGMQNAGKGSFEVSGPDPGRLQKGLVSFANKVAEIYGGTLVGLDGSTHSKYTVNGNVSEHYTGAATDIFTIGGKPATGATLIRAGRAALIAAGMPREQALKAPGGLYNVGNHQIIFGVDGKQYGGNHLDHLHISSHGG